MAEPLELIENLHRRAQASLGIMAAFLANSSWPSGGGKKLPNLDGWADYSASQVLELRELARELTISYYQLARWHETGFSLGLPLDGEYDSRALLSTFISRVQAVSDIADSGSDLGADIRSAIKRKASSIPVDVFNLEPFIKEFEREYKPRNGALRHDRFTWPNLASGEPEQAKIAKTLKRFADQKVGNRISAMEAVENDSQRIIEQAREILDNANLMTAGKADSLVLEAARGVSSYAQARDQRVRVYARGTSSNPCAWCAMLASRGFVYLSETSATKTSESGSLKSYHPNCHCFPIVRWSTRSKLPALNQYFMDNWPKVTKGLSGDAAFNKWRSWINQERTASRSGNRRR